MPAAKGGLSTHLAMGWQNTHAVRLAACARACGEGGPLYRRIRQHVNERRNVVGEVALESWLREDGEMMGIAHRWLQDDVRY